MRFPAYRIEITDDRRIKITQQFIDDTELINDDPEARSIISAKDLFSEQELNNPTFTEPHPMIMGENIHIHGRFIVDSLCKAFLQIHPDAENRSIVGQMAKTLLNGDVVAPEAMDSNPVFSDKACYLATWEEVEQFALWIRGRGPY